MEETNVKVLEIIQQDRAVKDFLLYRARILRDEFGIESVFVCWNGPFIEEIRKEFRIHTVDFKQEPSLAKDLRAIRRIKKIIDEECPDIIHTHFNKPGIIGRLAARFSKHKPLVFHQVHGFYFDRLKRGWKRNFYENIEKFFGRHFSDYLLFQNKYNLDYSKKKGFLKHSQKYIYLGNGINLEKFIYSEHRNNRKMKILSIGRLEQMKNHIQLFRAIHRLTVTNNSSFTVCVVVVGDGGYRSSLEKEVEELHLSEYIHFIGRKDDVRELLADSDCLVLTSKAEGKPRVVMEAMASGLPVIATRNPGTEDLIEDSISGYLVDIDDYETLANRITQLGESYDLRKKMAKEARAFIEQNCNEKEIARRLGNVFLSYSKNRSKIQRKTNRVDHC